MLTSLRIEGFRGLQSLSVERLARINLFVGMNQAGKTSLLDAVQLLLDGGRARALHQCQARRNECFAIRQHEDGSTTVAPRLDTLFRGSRLRPGVRFALSGAAPTPLHVHVTVEPYSHGSLPRHRAERPLPAWAELWSRLAVRIDTHEDEVSLPIPHDEATLRKFHRDGLDDGFDLNGTDPPIDFIDVAGIDTGRLIELWGDIPLTPREHELVTALQVIEPALEGIALIPGLWSASSELVLKLRGFDDRMHLGDMGEGFRRMLGLLLALPGTPRGELLIDEIDTGLHYSVLPSMWQLVLDTARRRDIQVFATTHSWDCVAALARLYQLDPGVEADILLHRIDHDRDRVTTYEAQEIETLMKHQIEVRG